MLTRDDVHRLIDNLSDDEFAQAAAALEGAIDPVVRALLLAPLDDEPETDEERAAVAEAWQDVAAGRLIAHEDLKRELGL